MTNPETTSTLSPYSLADEIDKQALQYKDFTTTTMTDVAASQAAEKVCSTATAQMTLYFSGIPQLCKLRVVRTATDKPADGSKNESKEREFTWDSDDGKWREVANDFKNEELADKLRDWLVSGVD